jgi:hypothetical protein
MCLQLLIGPMFAYNGLDRFVYSMYAMKVPEETYFSYVIPAVLCFIFGLHLNAGKLKGEVIDENMVKDFSERQPDLPYIFIAIGFFASLLATWSPANISTSDAVAESGGGGGLIFVFYLLGSLKYIGAFIIILGKRGIKIIPMILVYGSIISTSLGSGMFHDLLTWVIMLGAIAAIRFKPSNFIKTIFTLGFIILAFTIQIAKSNYRSLLGNVENAGVTTFTQALEQSESKNDVFDIKSLAISNIRINQGFIITNIIKTVPDRVPYANGDELGQILEAAFLPRFLAPGKLEAGDQKIFNKYTGMQIGKGTSMGLSSVGDAYINFGIIGGCIFMFFLGLLYNEILKAFHRYGKTFPILLLFIPLVFYYPIRPDCDLQTIFGHVVKSCFLIFVIFLLWRKTFMVHTVTY